MTFFNKDIWGFQVMVPIFQDFKNTPTFEKYRVRFRVSKKFIWTGFFGSKSGNPENHNFQKKIL